MHMGLQNAIKSRPKSAAVSGGGSAKSSKRKTSKKHVTLEKIIGLTTERRSGLAANPKNGNVAYCAGGVVVVYDPKKNRQAQFFMNKSERSKTGMSCVAFSENGKYLAAGERGHKPSVLVWDLTTGQQVSEMKGHKYGVSCIEWSPNGKYLLSVGQEHDGFGRLWEWKFGKLTASCKIAPKRKTPKIHSLSFSDDGSQFVIAGEKMVKIWSMEAVQSGTAKYSTPMNCYLIGQGSNCILNTLSESTFRDVGYGRGKFKDGIYCITEDGILCMFSSSTHLLEKWVALKSSGGFTVHVTEKYIACGCASGVIRLFEPDTLKFVCTLPKPPPVHTHLTTANIVLDNIKPDTGSKDSVFGDVIALQLSSDNQKLHAVYNDRSFFVWDINDPKKVGKYRSFLAHGGCIWDVDVLPVESTCPLPKGVFVTSSADNTIRLWNVDQNGTPANRASVRESIASKNVFSKNLLHVIDLNAAAKEAVVAPRNESNPEENVERQLNGIRSVKFSNDGCYIASGDRQGMLRVHDVFDFQVILEKQAHDAEVLSLDFSEEFEESQEILLASGSRDRLVHVFNISNKLCDIVQSLDDHSSSITSVKFAKTASGTKLFTCSADKSVVFRTVNCDGLATYDISRYYRTVIPYGTIYDMDVDASQKYIATAGGDKRINIWRVDDGKSQRSYKADVNASGAEPIKVVLGPAGIHIVTSSTDKILRLYDFYSGNMMASFRGHSELITGVKFTNDCKRIISVSGDGCIFVWRLSNVLCKNMQDRLTELHAHKKRKPPQEHMMNPDGLIPKLSDFRIEELEELPEPPLSARSRQYEAISTSSNSTPAVPSSDIKAVDTTLIPINFSETALPAWAKKLKQNQAADEKRPTSANNERNTEDGSSNNGSESARGRPSNRWAERAGEEGYKLFSENYNLSRLYPFSQTTERRSLAVDDFDKSLVNQGKTEGSSDNNTSSTRKISSGAISASDDDDSDVNVFYESDNESSVSDDQTIYFDAVHHEPTTDFSTVANEPASLKTKNMPHPKGFSPSKQSEHTKEESLPATERNEVKVENDKSAEEMEDDDEEEEEEDGNQLWQAELESADVLFKRHFESLAEPVKNQPLRNNMRVSISTKFLRENSSKDKKEQVSDKMGQEQTSAPSLKKDVVLVNDGRLSTGAIIRTIREDIEVSNPSHPPPPPPDEQSSVFDQLRLIKSRFTDFKTERREESQSIPESQPEQQQQQWQHQESQYQTVTKINILPEKEGMSQSEDESKTSSPSEERIESETARQTEQPAKSETPQMVTITKDDVEKGSIPPETSTPEDWVEQDKSSEQTHAKEGDDIQNEGDLKEEVQVPLNHPSLAGSEAESISQQMQLSQNPPQEAQQFERPESSPAPTISQTPRPMSTTKRGVHLSKSVMEYESAINKLENVFSEALEMFDEVDKSTQFDPFMQGRDTGNDGDMDHLMKSFQGVFDVMQEKLQKRMGSRHQRLVPEDGTSTPAISQSARIQPDHQSPQTAMIFESDLSSSRTANDSSVVASSQMLLQSASVDLALDRYSSMLVEMVQRKLFGNLSSQSSAPALAPFQQGQGFSQGETVQNSSSCDDNDNSKRQIKQTTVATTSTENQSS